MPPLDVRMVFCVVFQIAWTRTTFCNCSRHNCDWIDTKACKRNLWLMANLAGLSACNFLPFMFALFFRVEAALQGPRKLFLMWLYLHLAITGSVLLLWAVVQSVSTNVCFLLFNLFIMCQRPFVRFIETDIADNLNFKFEGGVFTTMCHLKTSRHLVPLGGGGILRILCYQNKKKPSFKTMKR